MSFARKLRRKAGTESTTLDWVAGMVQASVVEGETDQVTVFWLKGEELLAEQTVHSDEAQAALVSTFGQALLKQGRRPARVRAQGEGMAEVLRRTMPPSVNVVRAPTPELYGFLERREGVPPGTYTEHLPTASGSFVEVPPFGRVAAEVLANVARSGHPVSDSLRISCAAIGLEDAVMMHRAPPDELPSLFIFRDYQAVREALQNGSNEAWDQGLFHYRLGYVRDPNLREEERGALQAEGWSFANGEPNLRPLGCVVDGPRGIRPPNDAEYEAFRVAAYATVAMLDAPMEVSSYSEHEMCCTLVFKLDEHRVANVHLTWKVDLQKLGGVVPRHPR